jgi:hypothetical protein
MATLEIAAPQVAEFFVPQNVILDFFVTCFIYDDNRDHHLEPNFYALRRPPPQHGVRPVTPTERYALLLSGFECSKLEWTREAGAPPR